MIVVFAKIAGELAQWEVATGDPAEAIQLVREALPNDYVGTVLARVK